MVHWISLKLCTSPAAIQWPTSKLCLGWNNTLSFSRILNMVQKTNKNVFFCISLYYLLPDLMCYIQDSNLCLKKLAFAFLTACVYWFLTSLKSCISWGLLDANAERHRMFLCWSRAIRSGVNLGQYLFLDLLLFFIFLIHLYLTRQAS